MVYGFYVAIGGLAFYISEFESKKFSTSKTNEIWFIDVGGLQVLTQLEYSRKIIPDLLVEEIKSKSKANGLAKALVCIQALWFIVQCLTRRE